MPEPSDIPIGAYANAAAHACAFELRCRLLADNASMGDRILTVGLDALVKQLCERFAGALSAEQVALVKSCAVLRNKLLHLELARHAGKLVSLGEHLDRGAVTTQPLTETTVAEIAAGTFPGPDARRVSDTAILTGRVYGWLWESLTSGAFDKTAARFRDALLALDRMREALNAEPAAP